MKRIISFSVYGKNPMYAHAVLKNINLQPAIYPGWTCRVYLDETVPDDVVKEIGITNAEIVVKPKSNGHLGMFWRFEPLKDRSIDRFIVRDSDSRLNIREAAAVQEWIESEKEFHIMRDNPQHAAQICGGMWGASSKFIAKEAAVFDNEVKTYLQNIPFNRIQGPRGMYFNTDQPWLWQYIWPKIVNSHIAHIMDLPNLRFTGKEKLFPIENPDKSFVGQPFENNI